MSVTNLEGTPLHPLPPRDVSRLAESMIRKRIMHTLAIFPRLSHSMLQIGIGTGFPPALWHPVLEALIGSGEVRRFQVKALNPVSGREQVYTILEANRTVAVAA